MLAPASLERLTQGRARALQAGIDAGLVEDARELARTAREAHEAELAGVEDCIRFEVADAGKFHRDSEYGQLVTNPPYGERLGEFPALLQVQQFLLMKLQKMSDLALAPTRGLG